jgi:lipopolysaccharide/colanic/teichoic acid biosynthesis glycosyltransferase
MYRGKRCLDLAILGLSISALPIFLLIAGLVYLVHGSPVLFRQRRAGFHGSSFEILKFRTMTGDLDGHGDLLPDADRLTILGRLLRATSLDEVPELINVLRGEMSIVGPRPLHLRYLERYNPEQRKRLDVLPGITGWAQVNGRNGIGWEERFAFDLDYIEHMSFALDLKILFLTLFRVIAGSGISEAGHATMTEFMGSKARHEAVLMTEMEERGSHAQ